MANNTLKNKFSVPGVSLKITPSNSPVLKPSNRSPLKSPAHQSSLSLQTVVGTTTSSPTGFSCHESSKSFAFCAGSAAVLAEVDEDLNISQRFFRARPGATGVNSVPSFYNPSTPPTTPEPRNRPIPSARSLGNGYSISPGNETWSSRERVKAVTSVSLSPNGRFLAVGETGYNPRVLIFSTAKDSPLDVPLSVITEHSFGIHSLAFSPNSQHLATLGDANDGFLFVWSVNLKSGAARLHSTNKCTSFIRDMCWTGQSLITVGVRHVKVWRLADATPGSPTKAQKHNSESAIANSAPRALSGRNCVLGSLGESTFTCATRISDHEAIVCSDSGAVCILDDADGQTLRLVKRTSFGVMSAAVDLESGALWLGGKDQEMEKCTIDELKLASSSSPPSPPAQSLDSFPKSVKSPSIISIGIFPHQMITIDSGRAIRIRSREEHLMPEMETPLEVSLPAHTDSVLGIGVLKKPNIHSADFFTWSSGGTVSFWSLEGKCLATRVIKLEQLAASEDDVMNELKVVRASEDLGEVVSGDRYGVIRLTSGNTWDCTSEVRAHGGDVTDIAIHEYQNMCLVATCGRDRMVQLFHKTGDALNLTQTMDEHVGAVGRLLFMNDGEKLLSCSADRTVLIRDRVTREVEGSCIAAFVLSRVITLKSSPVSMTLTPEEPDSLVLSTLDRQIQLFDVPTGRHIHSFRVSDTETADTAVMSSLVVGSEILGLCPRLLLGVSTTDKSIRVYDLEKDVLLTREFGHTEGVTDVALLESEVSDSKTTKKRTIISTGLDGLVMIWDLTINQQPPPENLQTPGRCEEDTPAKESTAAKPPLRRILSKSEISGFQKSDGLPASPSPLRELSPPRTLRKKVSRRTLGPPLSKNGTPSPSPNRYSPTFSISSDTRSLRGRSPSPSPPSPKAKSRTIHRNSHRSSIELRPRPKNSEFGSLNMSTEQVCRTLRAYRKKLNSSAEQLKSASELERELELTVRALKKRSTKSQDGDTETDSSGKENEKLASTPSHPPLPMRTTRRVPSTPSLGRTHNQKVTRSLSLDAHGEG